MSNLQSKYNLKSPGVKRLMREAMELAEATEEYHACPLEDNLFEWHFTVRGPPGTEFDGGLYHGRILLPTQYPMQPPNIILLTPNGRFEVNKKICLSISGYHPESWQPSWSIRTALLALIAFMPTPAAGTVGSLDYTPEERKLAEDRGHRLGGNSLTAEESSLLQQISLKAEEDNIRLQEKGEEATSAPPVADCKSVDSGDGVAVAVRQRLVSEENATALAGVDNHDSLLQASIQRSNRDRVWSAVIWAIISMITLLVIRRFFFL
ncbi:hypothetical protein Trydic_g216 [Trypoxylus dichotomus]